MNKETLDLLQALAAKLGTTAEHLWSVMIRQAYVSFGTDLFSILLMSGLFAFSLATMRKLRAEARSMDEGDMGRDILYIQYGVLGIVAIILACIAIFGIAPSAITKITNPEYWALSQLLETVKGAK